MPLQNRVVPTGDIIADSNRGLFMGNRGGKIHDPETRTLHPTKRWASKQWICCLTEFKGRKRVLMGNGYTEMFFLDEVTALAAGHRPCFECRNAQAKDFAERWRESENGKKRPLVKEIDAVLHGERLKAKQKKTHDVEWEDLPDGAMIQHQDVLFAKKNGAALRWFAHGYERWSNLHFGGPVACLTPPKIVAVLKAGYTPVWHESAEV